MPRPRTAAAAFVPGLAPEPESDINGTAMQIRETAAAGLPTRERDYLVPAKDQKGASTRFQCRASPEYGMMLTKVLTSKRYPFRVQGDIVRWAIVEGVKRLLHGAGIPSVLGQAEAIRQILIDEEYHLEFDDHCRVLKRTIDRHIQRRAFSQARALLLNILPHIDAMPDGYWKEQYVQHLMGEYGYLLEGQRGTGLEGSQVSIFSSVAPPTEIPTRARPAFGDESEE